MASRKVTISLPEDLADRLIELASRAGLPVSAWIARAAVDRARLEDGLAALREWERESGPVPPDLLAKARAALADADAAMLAIDRPTG